MQIKGMMCAEVRIKKEELGSRRVGSQMAEVRWRMADVSTMALATVEARKMRDGEISV